MFVSVLSVIGPDNTACSVRPEQAIEQQDSAVASARTSLNEAEVRYKAGSILTSMSSPQTALLAAQQAAGPFREQHMVAGVQLVKALGGGWGVSVCPRPRS